MRNIKTLVCLVAVLLAAVSCHREKDPVTPEEVYEFSSVPVSIQNEGSEETRSQVLIETENFKKASLFAFYRSSGQIAVYPDHAGDLAGSGPVAIEVTGTSFSWALPVGVDLDIYVIGNYGSDSSELGSFVKQCRSNANLKESDLNNLTFNMQDIQVQSMSYLQSMGIPMGSKTQVRLNSTSSSLTLKVKRLFARYDLWFNLSELESHGYEVKALTISSHRVNSSVPFFQENYKPTSGFIDLDYATDGDLMVVKRGGEDNYVTLFIPENCQGNISGASSWDKVVSLGNRVQNCTYLDIYMNVGMRPDASLNENDGFDRSYPYRVYLYLGSDFTTNFDVVRNTKTVHSVVVPFDDPGPVEYFKFNDLETVTVQPGGNLYLDYTTNLSKNQISFKFNDASTGADSNSLFNIQEFSSMEANFTVSSSVAPGRKFIVTGGKIAATELESTVSSKPVQIASPYTYDVDIEVWRGASPMQVGGTYILKSRIIRYKNGVMDYSNDAPMWPGTSSNAPYELIGQNTIGQYSVVSGSGVSVTQFGEVTATQETTAVIRASAPAPDGNTYYEDVTLVFTRGMTYELRIMLNSEDSGFDPNNQPESASGSAAVNEYVEMRAYMYKVNNGQDLERTNVTGNSNCTWNIVDNVTGEAVSGVTITQDGNNNSPYVRLRSTSAIDVKVQADYLFNNFGYGHLCDDIPVSWTSGGGGGGETGWDSRYISLSLQQSGTGTITRYRVVASEAVPCNVTVTVKYNNDNTMTFTLSSGSTQSSLQRITGSNVRITATDPESYDDSVNKIHYFFAYSN